jgi:monolysocardiolipin acyltransferase
MSLSGFDALMPEGRPAPYKYLPRPFQSLRVVFGNPLSEDDVRSGLIECASRAVYHDDHSQTGATAAIPPWLFDAIKPELDNGRLDLDSMRSEVTALIQKHVEALVGKTLHNRQH